MDQSDEEIEMSHRDSTIDTLDIHPSRAAVVAAHATIEKSASQPLPNLLLSEPTTRRDLRSAASFAGHEVALYDQVNADLIYNDNHDIGEGHHRHAAAVVSAQNTSLTDIPLSPQKADIGPTQQTHHNNRRHNDSAPVVHPASSFSSLSSTDKRRRHPLDTNERHSPVPLTGNGGAKKRKRHRRDRSFLVRLTVSLKDAHLMRHPWDTDATMDRQFRQFDDDGDADHDDPHQQAYVTPDFKHLFYLTAALMLCTGMAVFSAYDAELHCLQHEALAVWQLVDDDASFLAAAVVSNGEEGDEHDNFECVQMFRDVVLPTGIATILSSLLVLAAIYCHSRSSAVGNSTNVAAVCATTNTSPLMSDSESQSSAIQQVNASNSGGSATSTSQPHEWRPVIRVTLLLFMLFVVILGLQTYNVTVVMLKPRADLNEDNDQNNNPYQSLAAVDRYGHVGDNANLYYLAWLSEALAITLVYQVATAFFRVVRAARRQTESTSDGLIKPATAQHSSAEGRESMRLAKEPKSDRTTLSASERLLLRATSWDRGDHNHTLTESQRVRKRLLNDQSRAAWYSSLYRLRVRTGMWTAACISCLIIVASSQYIWRQVLWPYIASIVQRHDDDFSYFSICQTATYYSSGRFSSQLCRRTLNAWCSGLLAAILCATAIAMHQVARYSPSRNSHVAAVAAASGGRDDEVSSPHPLRSNGAGSNGAKTSSSSHPYYDHDVIHLLTTPDGICPTTTSAWKNALVPSALLSRYYSHHHPKRLPLRTELGLAFVLSIVLGVNAVLVTGVQGPALKVGNLYYSSWLSFLLCMRICLGCVEEYYNIIEEEEDDVNGRGVMLGNNSSENASTASGKQSDDKVMAYRAPDLNSSGTTVEGAAMGIRKGINGAVVATDSIGSKDNGQASQDASNSAAAVADSQEKKRLARVRGYFFLTIFSTVCAASSYDAAANQYKALSREQKFMMYIPLVVAAISLVLFTLSLSKHCYEFISQFWIGGVLSIVSFNLWLGDLLLTMHSEDSWAVNSIGEIAMANLYYFAWASIITAGIQMTSYIKALFGIEQLDYMSAVWVAICKVCFVILGASLHIWHTISDNCEFDEITLGAVSFCSRTILAIVVSLTGMLVGGLVVLGRLLVTVCPVCQCGRFQAHVEMLISLFLMFLFVAAVAMITGIGGPGQSVGDLYYSTWLAFWVSLGIFVSCYNQLNEKEEEIDGQQKQEVFGGLEAPSTKDSVLV